MKSKKILTYILVTVAIFGIIFGPLNAGRANASAFDWRYPFFGFLDPTKISQSSTVLKIGIEIIYYAIWTPSSWFLSLGGMAMDTSIDMTIKDPSTNLTSFTSGSQSAVAIGWKISRDIVNIFLIFILLYIAIATILQLSGYGAKQLLITLIIIAFLVNFSLVITKLIIDASNILTTEFYNSLVGENKSVSKIFELAFNLDKIPTSYDALSKIKDPSNVIIALLMGSALMVIAGFLFLIFGIVFLIRMVVLLILMIFAPLAFAAHVLPSTKKYASDWWHQLFSQSFFAPAALFMLYISATIANSPVIKNILGQTKQGLLDMTVAATTEGSSDWTNIFKLFTQFIIIAILLCASLVVAKKMGAIGADAAQKGVSKGLRKAQGYAGKIGRNLGTRGAGYVSEKMLESKGRVAGALKSLPLVSRGLARVSGLEEDRRKKQVEKYQKGYGSYSKAGLEALEKDPTIFGAKRKALEKVLETRKPEEKEKQRQKTVKELNEVSTNSTIFAANIKSILPRDIENFNKDVILGAGGSAKLEEMVSKFGQAHLQKIIDRGDEFTDKFFEKMADIGNSMGGTLNALATELETRGNFSLASQVRTNPGIRGHLQSRGLT